MAEQMAIHCVEIEDKAGSLHELLGTIAAAGVDLHCFIACSCGGKGCVCLGAKDPAALEACLSGAGISVTEMAGFSIDGDDKVGAAADALKGLADAGVSGVAGAGMVCDSKFHMGVVVNAADGETAGGAL
jgi:hypothetical protein